MTLTKSSFVFDIRDASPNDLSQITEIYAHSVLHGTGTFAIDPPPLSEIEQRFQEIKAMGLSYSVATEGSMIIGFGYCAPFRTRPGYAYCVEDSLYLAPAYEGARYRQSLT